MAELTARHSAIVSALEHFAFDHLPDQRLQLLSSKFADLAHELADLLPDDPDVTDGLRKLWEVKNCCVYVAARKGFRE